MDVFPVDWSVGDTGPGGTCRVTAFGKTPEGESACVHVVFTPFFYVAAPPGFSPARCRPLLAEWAKRFGALADRCRVVMRRSIWGFRNATEQPFVQLVFASLEDFRRARYGLAREYDTYEGGVDPIIRLFHLRGLGPCRWMRVQRSREPKLLVADVDVEVECSFLDVGPSPRTDRPPLVFASECVQRGCGRAAGRVVLGGSKASKASPAAPPRCLEGFDIECISGSGRFPVADRPEDKLIQISTAFQRYGEAEPYARTVVCLGDTSPVEGVHITWHEHEHQVIEAWARLVREHKTDVMVGYNTHQVKTVLHEFPRKSTALPRLAHGAFQNGNSSPPDGGGRCFDRRKHGKHRAAGTQLCHRPRLARSFAAPVNWWRRGSRQGPHVPKRRLGVPTGNR